MRFRLYTALLPLAALTVLLSLSPVRAQGPFKLKTGARGEICLTCHLTLKEKLAKRFIHTPLAEGDCAGCHDPHTSSHGKLMAADPDTICYNCHESMVPEGARSVHQVVAEGRCISCHDPHSADAANNLVRAGSELCFGCHEDLGKEIGGYSRKHSPVQKDCLRCHNPHASADNEKLLSTVPPALCLGCHSAATAGFKRLHLDYPVEKAVCTSCHNPHGSSSAAILYDNVHQPVSNKMCNQCHGEPGAAEPFKLKKAGAEVCQGCHYELMTETLNLRRLHWPLVDRKGCINCHAPHASARPGLLKGPMLKVCGSCHEDTIARQERSQTEHPPMAAGECTTCHAPHASDNVFLATERSTLELCAKCHEWQTHSTHPIGEKVADPRNKNLTLQCLSCHRAHGTEYKSFLYFETTKDLCVQCHIEYRR